MSDTATKIKSKNRKKRYTFPDELDECNINIAKPKRRHSIQITTEDDLINYNERHIIITKNDDVVKKEIIIKKYTKIHPVVNYENITNKDLDDETNANNSTQVKNACGILYKIAIKILCYIGLLSCIAI